ncbi:MAG: phage tail protein, partial [Rhodanobacter sp.]
MGKAKNITIGYKYYLGLHMGMCRGQIDSLLEIKVGDRTAWSGNLRENAEFGINKPELFGGTKAEGGIDGTAWLMLGDANQTVPSRIQGWLGGLIPGFRGTSTLFFDGMVCAMSPYPKAWKMKSFRAKKGWDGDVWYAAKCQIDIVVQDKNGNDLTINAMNPSHIIYQVCTDRAWGRGMPRSVMDDAAFRRAADTLFEEGLGLCLAWKRQDTLDSFVQTILDHIGAVVYVDKRTGLFTVKLIRQDYVRSQVPLFDMDSGLLSIEESSVSAAAETVNEVVVNWHDPITNQDSAVREQNLASIQTSGAVYSTTNDYPGIPTPLLAQRLAKRDLIYSTLPLRTFQITCDRRAWRIQPGDVMRIQDPTRGQIDIAIRVGTVDDGTLTDGKIKIAAVEDVFTMPMNVSAGVEPGQWQPPDVTPKIARRRAYEIPYANLHRLYPKAEFQAIDYDAGMYGMAAEKPTPMTQGYDLALRPNNSSWTIDGNGDFVPLGELTTTIGYLGTSIPIYKGMDLEDVEFPCAIMVGEEIIKVTGVALGEENDEAVLT